MFFYISGLEVGFFKGQMNVLFFSSLSEPVVCNTAPAGSMEQQELPLGFDPLGYIHMGRALKNL